MPTRVADVAEYITERRRTYDEALAADMRRLAKAHGEAVVRDALALVEGMAKPAQWDAAGHREAVQKGIERTIALRRLAGLSGLSE